MNLGLGPLSFLSSKSFFGFAGDITPPPAAARVIGAASDAVVACGSDAAVVDRLFLGLPPDTAGDLVALLAGTAFAEAGAVPLAIPFLLIPALELVVLAALELPGFAALELLALAFGGALPTLGSTDGFAAVLAAVRTGRPEAAGATTLGAILDRRVS